MNKPECKKWWDDYQAKFPSAGKWAAGLGEDQWREVYAAWERVLATVPLADALEVNQSMRDGGIDPIGTFDSDRERIGHCVCSEAKGLAYSRRPKQTPDWKADRYRCGLCRDTGLVECFTRRFLGWLSSLDEFPTGQFRAERYVDESGKVWLLRDRTSEEVILASEERPKNTPEIQHMTAERFKGLGWRMLTRFPQGRYTQMVLCSCDAGEALVWRGEEKHAPANLSKTRIDAPPQCRYSPDNFWRVPTGMDADREEWSRAVEWYAAKAEEPQFEEFEHWNDR